MHEFPFSSQGPERGEDRFLREAETNADYSRSFYHAYLMYVGPGSEERRKCDKYLDSPQANRTRWHRGYPTENENKVFQSSWDASISEKAN